MAAISANKLFFYHIFQEILPEYMLFNGIKHVFTLYLLTPEENHQPWSKSTNTTNDTVSSLITSNIFIFCH